jgi:hypothetical protein
MRSLKLLWKITKRSKSGKSVEKSPIGLAWVQFPLSWEEQEKLAREMGGDEFHSVRLQELSKFGFGESINGIDSGSSRSEYIRDFSESEKKILRS